jgi:hypothetical protein
VEVKAIAVVDRVDPASPGLYSPPLETHGRCGLSGVLVAVEVSARGGWSAVVDVVRGSVPRGQVAVTHISETLHPLPASTAIGAPVDAVGLYETGTPAVYGLRDSGLVRIE